MHPRWLIAASAVLALTAAPAGAPSTAAAAGPVSAPQGTVALTLGSTAGLTGVLPGDAARTNPPSAGTRLILEARVDCRKVRCVALTFDDGPYRYTGKLLNTLEAAHVHATFFLVGAKVSKRPGLVRRMIADGHEVGNHTWSHLELTRLSLAGQRSQVTRGARAIRAAHVPRPRLLRPPFGSFNRLTRSLGVPLINWDVDTLDWKYQNSASVIRRALRDVKRGSIILMHDTLPTTVSAVPQLIRKLRAKGFVLVTVSQLLGSTKPGHVYFNGRR